jgi:hypothetical protein
MSRINMLVAGKRMKKVTKVRLSGVTFGAVEHKLETLMVLSESRAHTSLASTQGRIAFYPFFQ